MRASWREGWSSEYGLSSAVFSQNINRALKAAQRIQAGMCHINGPTVHDDAQMAFGGIKSSGYGRFGARAGIAEFTELRWITVAPNTSTIHSSGGRRAACQPRLKDLGQQTNARLGEQ